MSNFKEKWYLFVFLGIVVICVVVKCFQVVDEVIKEEQFSHSWPSASCYIVNGEIDENCLELRCFYRSRFLVRYFHPSSGNITTSAFPYSSEFFFEQHDEATQFLATHPQGKFCMCWYDPFDTTRVKLVQDEAKWENEKKSMFAALYFILLSVVAIGFCGYSMAVESSKRQAQELLEL
eukprot:c37129_g1_i1.p1 GENE.c37129_g1_i1~~c37129_g1_i1.p1  ORF type:complete len:178 (+),score=56.20 c37129_g1_i1:62-595(+)